MVEYTSIYQYVHNAQLYGKKRERQILRTILISKKREYKRSLKRQVDGDIIYDGNVYLSNYRIWFAGCYYDNTPHFTKTNIQRVYNHIPRWLIKDSIIYQSPATELNDTIGLECGCYSESLFVLTSTSYLIRYRINQDCFIEAESIYLGNKYKFKHLSYDRIFDRLIVKSQRLASRESAVFYYYALFSAAPLKFIGILPISKKKFAKTANSFISSGMLAILSSKKIYSLYNIEYILENFMIKFYHVGDTLDVQETMDVYNIENSNAVIGSFPYGLPTNIDMDKESHDNYQIYSCFGERVNFGGFPWHCLVVHQQNVGNSCIYNLSNGNVVARITDDESMSALNEKHPFFHVDNSGRILKTNHDNVVCYKIADHHPKNPDDNLDVCFKISIPTTQAVSRNSHSRFGRQITQSYRFGTSLKSDVIHAMDYDEELDVIAILFTDVCGDLLDVYKVGLYDNQNGEIIRVINLDEEIPCDDDNEWTIYFSDLLLICILKSIACKGRTMCFMYQLGEVS